MAAVAVVVLGAGLTVAGLLEGTLYDIGIMVVVLGAVGVVVRLVDVARSLLS